MKPRPSGKRSRAALASDKKSSRKQSFDSSPSGDPDAGVGSADDEHAVATSKNPYEARGLPGEAATMFAQGCKARTHCCFCAEFRRMPLKQWLMLSFNPTPLADAFSDAGALSSSSASMHSLAYNVAPLSSAHPML